MANTFKTVTFAAEPASAGTPYVMYTVAGSTTTVVLGLRLTNIHTTSVSVEVELLVILQIVEDQIMLLTQLRFLQRML